MPIKNYTTKVNATKTAAEITMILARFRARRIQQEFDEHGVLVALSFSLSIEGAEIGYRLPARPEGVLRALKKDRVPPRYRNLTHAKSVAWRIVKDWLEAQLALVQAEAAPASEVFLPYMLVGHDGDGHPETIMERIDRTGGLAAVSGNFLLGPGN